MLREKDPIAVELLARHGGVPMPQSGLDDAELAEVIAFLLAQDAAATPDPGAARPSRPLPPEAP
jgi:hypothetical protein